LSLSTIMSVDHVNNPRWPPRLIMELLVSQHYLKFLTSDLTSIFKLPLDCHNTSQASFSYLTFIVSEICPSSVCKQCTVFVIRSVSPLPFDLVSPYCWSWKVDNSQACDIPPWPNFHGLPTLLYLREVFVIRIVFPLPYNLSLPFLLHTLIMVGICQTNMWHLTFISFYLSTDFV